MFETQDTSATANSVDHERKSSNNNLRGAGVATERTGPSPLSSNEDRIISAVDNRDEFHIRERYLSRPSPQNIVRHFSSFLILIEPRCPRNGVLSQTQKLE